VQVVGFATPASPNIAGSREKPGNSLITMVLSSVCVLIPLAVAILDES
jgi:hypothetical protein